MVALARRIGVVLDRMWRDDTEFIMQPHQSLEEYRRYRTLGRKPLKAA